MDIIFWSFERWEGNDVFEMIDEMVQGRLGCGGDDDREGQGEGRDTRN